MKSRERNVDESTSSTAVADDDKVKRNADGIEYEEVEIRSEE